MAGFVNYGQTPQAENYTGRSRGVDVAGPNKAFGTLFEGIGTVVDTAIKYKDTDNQLKIGEELRTGIDAIRGAQGVDQAVNDPLVTGGETGSNVPGAAAPPGVASATSEIARINAAYKEGKIGDTYYYAKVESLARQVRNKYPGYRDIIDQKVSSIIGTNPANALRTSLLSDLKQAQSTAASKANSDETIIERGKEYISPEKYNRFISGQRDPEFVNGVKMDIQQGELKKQTVSSQKAQLELKKAQGADTKEEVTKIAIKESTDLVWKVINDGAESGAAGFNLNTLNQRIAGMATGKPLTPEEIGQIRIGFNGLRTAASTALSKLYSVNQGQSGWRYSSELGSDIEKVKEQALAPFADMEKALVDGNVGLFQYYANQAKLMKDQTIQSVLSRSQAARSLQAAQEILGPALGNLLLEGKVFSKAASEFSKALEMDGLVRSGTGTDTGLAIIKDNLREARAQGGPTQAKEYAANQLQSARNALTSKTLEPQALANVANTWFNPTQNFLTDKDILTENSRQSVLQQFAAPEVVANMARLKATNPDSWNNYKAWMESSTKAVFGGTAAQIAEWQKPGSGYEVTVDAQGRVSVAASRVSTPGSFAGAASAREAAVRGVEKQISQLNTALDARRLAAKEDGMDPAAAGLQFLGALGVNTAQPGKDKEASAGTPAPLAGEGERTASVQLASLTPDDRELVVELENPGEPIDLEARDQRRSRVGYNSDPNWQKAGENLAFTPDLRTGITQAAQELGVSPEDLATVISYETGGTFNPGIRGGAGNRHIGLIQFGPTEQKMYGASQDQTPGEQLKAVVKYLKHRGFRPGMDILDLYSTINAGSPGRYGASDAGNGGAPGTVRDKVQTQMAGHRAKARRLLAGE